MKDPLGLSEWLGVVFSLQRMFTPFKAVNRLLIPYHRFVGAAFLLQIVAATVIYNLDFKSFLSSPLWCSLPVCGVMQSASAAYYFRHTTPKKNDPGFMSMGDVGRLSWFVLLTSHASLSPHLRRLVHMTSARPLLPYRYFVCENIFFSSLLCFQSIYLHPSVHQTSITGFARIIIEGLFVFLPYYWRPLFPKTALRDSHKNRAKVCRSISLYMPLSHFMPLSLTCLTCDT